ncbi:MAG TPA: hypothetical protein VK612_02055 [Pyrinomonadaceae bacterium]|nr:hypothetical protein [Pyrinomonadaceae bacterium]
MNTPTDNEIKLRGMETLVENLGLVEAERFIALMNREGFDYTKWRQDLWEGKTVEEVSSLAMSRFKPKTKS